MTRHEIARLACRLMALYFLVQAIMPLGTLVLAMVSGLIAGGGVFRGDFVGFLAALIPPAMLGAIALWLWKKSEWMAARLLGERSSSRAAFEIQTTAAVETPQIPLAMPQERSEVTHLPLSMTDWTVIGFMVAGLSILVDGIHAFMSVAYVAIMNFRSYQSFGNLSPDSVITAALKTGIGLWLLLGSRGIVGTVNRMRGKYAEAPVKEPTEHGL